MKVNQQRSPAITALRNQLAQGLLNQPKLRKGLMDTNRKLGNFFANPVLDSKTEFVNSNEASQLLEWVKKLDQALKTAEAKNSDDQGTVIAESDSVASFYFKSPEIQD